ncbi:ATP/GTP-binding protein [Streptomyces sp. NPDC057540]|uniref:ATP/GTP-binding protein n=1 Tax=Streptomyces sp. NPDC057540 TaxID=3346160 RepID=UPI003694CF90
MMEQNGKLHAAMMKAKGDKAAARGKADADRTKASSSGMGADKGRSKAGGGGGGSSRGGGGAGLSRNSSSSPGPNKPGALRGPNSGASGGRSGAGSTGSGGGGKDRKKSPERPSGGHTAGSGRNGSSGGSKGSQAGSGGSGRSGSSKGDGGGRAERGPASSARAERARGRQDRAGLRQAGRQERRSAGHTAGLADRTKDRDQARANRQQAWEDRRAKRAERDAARKAKREAAASTTPGRTTLGQAVAEEAQRRWDKRRADAKDGKAGTEKVSLTKDKDKDKGADGKGEKTAKDGSDGASSATKDGKATDEPDKDSTTGDGASDGSKKRRRFRRRRTGADRAGGPGRARRTGRTGSGRSGRSRRRGRPADSPFGEEDSTPTVEWPDRPTRPPRTDTKGKGEDDIVDADIVPDGPAAVTTGVRGLPPAPEPHTARPGTSRPTSTEGSSVSSSQVSRPSGASGLAAQHQTDITFDEYLMEMAKIGLQAGADQERAEELMKALGKVADALREMAADLIGDHNVSTAVTDLIGDLADAAGRMKTQAERCAEECGIAWEAARLAAAMVARVYGEDMAAKEDAGLKHASAAAHHD